MVILFSIILFYFDCHQVTIDVCECSSIYSYVGIVHIFFVRIFVFHTRVGTSYMSATIQVTSDPTQIPARLLWMLVPSYGYPIHIGSVMGIGGVA